MAPEQAVAADPPAKQPPPEKAADARRRSLVVLSFWLVVVVLGLPIWWRTTTIYRADLPLDRMLQWAEGKVRLRPRPGGSPHFSAPSSSFPSPFRPSTLRHRLPPPLPFSRACRGRAVG